VSVRLRAMARASHPNISEAAEREVAQGASAIDAVAAGYFAAAGAHSGVLLGPVTFLLGGVGSGDRAFDGRVRQAGHGAKRPRGTPPDQEPPLAARVGVPFSLPALTVLLGYGAQHSLSRLVEPGIAAARACGAERRAAVLSRVAEVGALAFTEPELARALVREFGAPRGGSLTLSDFSRRHELDQPAARSGDAGARLLAPWAEQAERPLSVAAAVCAVDVHGVFAGAVFSLASSGPLVDSLELAMPLDAEPTWRGVARVRPGTPLSAAAPVWIALDASGAALEIWCAPGATRPATSEVPRFGIRRVLGGREVEPIDAAAS
jgi:gamma-glutamyltranspeptidase/glutathione hydrolase